MVLWWMLRGQQNFHVTSELGKIVKIYFAIVDAIIEYFLHFQ